MQDKKFHYGYRYATLCRIENFSTAIKATRFWKDVTCLKCIKKKENENGNKYEDNNNKWCGVR